MESRENRNQMQQNQNVPPPDARAMRQDDGFGATMNRDDAALKKQEYADQLRRQMESRENRNQNQHRNQPPPPSNPLDDGFGANMNRDDAARKKQEYANQLRRQMLSRENRENPNPHPSAEPSFPPDPSAAPQNQQDSGLGATWGEDKWENARRVKQIDPRAYGELLRQQMSEQHPRGAPPPEKEYHAPPVTPEAARHARANMEYKLQVSRASERSEHAPLGWKGRALLRRE
jgi:hypothetical protein